MRFRRELGKEDLFEYTRGGAGSTGPSRGEHRLTVYRAHTLAGRKENLNTGWNLINGVVDFGSHGRLNLFL